MDDVVILNLQRACQVTIDLAARIVNLKKLGIPKESRSTFVLMEEAGLLNDEISKKLQNMVVNEIEHDFKLHFKL